MFNLDSFQEPIGRDDADKVKSLLLEYGESLEDDGGSMWLQKLFLIAYGRGSFHVAEGLAKLRPQIASIKSDEDGYTAMHHVCCGGNVKMIKLLGTLNPQSLETLTSNQETVLHLAAKNSKCDAFEVLLDEIKNFNLEDVLNSKDENGDTVLHIATVNKSVKTVKLLVRECSNGNASLLSCRNNKGQTALDVCPSDSKDKNHKKIFKILKDAAAAHDQELCSPTDQYASKLTSEARNVLLMVLGLIAAAAFTVTCNLPEAFLKDLAGETLEAKDVIFGRLPTVFYLMVFNSAGFMTTMFIIVILIWPLLFRSILLFVVICTCIVYVMLVDKITPKLSVRIGISSISGIALLWSLAIVFTLSGVAILCLAKYSLLCFCRLVNCLWTRRSSYRSNNSGRFGSMVELGSINCLN
ncbi:ankyrin repeat-containing protein BDA1-like isoform X1 [Pistacia vera]|uniref:ankyrin repeat-containing protein BDA1-like isoform X1 n=2 Tax=Pistacia vera TaxID=55513 RepID=UPI001263868E|nr:ankyrin repeat-containing protein BDA1-like isoform X1 [Pistacia vera]